MAREFWLRSDNGWDYYVEIHFAWFPKLLNTGQVWPAFVWWKNWYETYPVDAQGAVIEMYRVKYLSDPRRKT